jgi:hypothetical protein
MIGLLMNTHPYSDVNFSEIGQDYVSIWRSEQTAVKILNTQQNDKYFQRKLCKGMDWIHLARDRALVNKVINEDGCLLGCSAV